MTTENRLGICMDHAGAHLIEFPTGTMETKNIESKFTHQEKADSIGKSENLMHNKEQHEQSDYYKKLGEVIRNYDEVILFGPTDAKAELYNTIKSDPRYAKIKIEIHQSDKMTENQEQAFVKEHFSV